MWYTTVSKSSFGNDGFWLWGGWRKIRILLTKMQCSASWTVQALFKQCSVWSPDFCKTYKLPPLHLVFTFINFVSFCLHAGFDCKVTLNIKRPQCLVLKNWVPKHVSLIFFRKC
jgi:hypothetical protein